MIGNYRDKEETILGVTNAGVGDVLIDDEVLLKSDPTVPNEGATKRYTESLLSTHEAEVDAHLSANDRAILAGIDVSGIDAKVALLNSLTGEITSQLTGLLKLSGGNVTGVVLQERTFAESGNNELLTKEGVDVNLFPASTNDQKDVGEVKFNPVGLDHGSEKVCAGDLVAKAAYPELAAVVNNEHDAVTHNYTTTSVLTEEYVNTVENVATTVTGALVFEDVVTQVTKIVKVPRTVVTYVNTTTNVTQSCMLIGISQTDPAVAASCGFSAANAINMTKWYAARGSDIYLSPHIPLMSAADNMVFQGGNIMPKPPFVIMLADAYQSSNMVMGGFVFTSPRIAAYGSGVQAPGAFQDAIPYINIPHVTYDSETNQPIYYPVYPVTWQETVSTPVYTTVYDDVTVVENVVTKVPVMVDKVTTTTVVDSVPRVVSSYNEQVFSLGVRNCDVYPFNKNNNVPWAFYSSKTWSLDQCRAIWASASQATKDWINSIPHESVARYSGLPYAETNTSWNFQYYSGPLNASASEFHALMDSGYCFPRLIRYIDGTPICVVPMATWNRDNSGRTVVDILVRYGLYSLYAGSGETNWPFVSKYIINYKNSTLVQTTVYDKVPRTVSTTTRVQKTVDTVIQVPTVKTQLVQTVKQLATWTETSDNPTPVTHFRLPNKPPALDGIDLTMVT